MARHHLRTLMMSIIPVAVAAACTSKSSGPGATADASFDAGSSFNSGSSSGAIGVVTVNGRQKLYLPTFKTNMMGHNVVSVIDVGIDGNGVAGAPALITDIDLGVTGDKAVLSSGDSSMVLVGSGQSRNIWLIDPQTDTLIKSIQLPASTQKTSFSIPDGYMNGIAVDSAHRKAYISVWNGFAVFDMDTMTITSTILVNPTENFAFDPVHEKLYAPFYDCTQNHDPDSGPPPTCATTMLPDGGGPISSGLSVVDLTDGTAYTYMDPTTPDPGNVFGNEPDSAGVDPNTQLVLIPDEFGDQYALDFSKAVFDKATKTVTAPHQIITTDAYDGVAVEPTSHFGFFEHEFVNNVGLLNGSAFTVGKDRSTRPRSTRRCRSSCRPSCPTRRSWIAASSTTPPGRTWAIRMASPQPSGSRMASPSRSSSTRRLRTGWRASIWPRWGRSPGPRQGS